MSECEWTHAWCSEGQRDPCGAYYSPTPYCGHYEHEHAPKRTARCEAGRRWMPFRFHPIHRRARCRRRASVAS